nr:hypothetical protein [Tanacetum cinerariifolium]
PTEPSTSKPYKKHKSKKQQPQAPKFLSPEPSLKHQIPSPSNNPIPDADKDSLTLQVLMDLCTRLSNKVMDLEIKAAKLFTEVVTTAEPTTAAAQVPKESAPKRRRSVVIQDPEEKAASVIVHTDVKSKDKGKGILIEEPKPLKCQAQIEQDEAFARQLEVRKNMMIYLKNMASFNMDFFKGMTYSEIKPIFKKHYNSIQAFLEKEEEVTIQEKEIDEKGHKREGESLEQEIAKKQRMDEEEEEIKRHLQILANNDDDVNTKTTPLASKVPVVDYQIHHENNKPYYKIIRADGTHNYS